MNEEKTTAENRILSEEAQQLPPDNGRGMEQTQPPPEDWFNIEKLRLSQDFTLMTGVEKLLTTVPIRKPGRQDFIRTQPEESYRVILPILELK